MPRPTPDDDSSEIADIGWLAESTEPSTPAKPAAAGAASEPVVDEYDLADLDEPPSPPSRTPPISDSFELGEEEPAAPARPSKRAKRDEEEIEDGFLEPTPEPPAENVSQPWDRMAEWGPDLARLGLVTLGVLFAWYLLFSPTAILWDLILVGGGFAVIALATYPMLITLERPVRMTPEQAVNDFFDAVEHHAPHFRRMWLLLSDDGRQSVHFSNYAQFKTYWQGRLAELRGPGAGTWTPLVFDVQQFKSGKTQGKSHVDASFTVSVRRRKDEDGSGPRSTRKMEITLSRAADRMWYLDDGTLP